MAKKVKDERHKVINALKLRLKVIQRAAEISRSTFDLDKILDQSMDLLMEVIPSEAASLYFVVGDRLDFTIAKGEKSDQLVDAHLKMGQGIAGWVAKTGIPYMTNDVVREPKWESRIAEEIRFDTRNILSVPVKSKDEVVAVVQLINRRESGEYEEDDQEMATLFSAHLANVLESTRLYKEVSGKVERLGVLMDASIHVTSTLDLEEVLDLIMSQAKEVLYAEASSIFLIDENKKELYFISATGTGGRKAKRVRVPWGKGIVGWVAETGETLLVPNVLKDKRFYKRVDEETDFVTKSILAVPLVVKGRVVGVAEVLNKRGDESFAQEDVELFEAFARHAAVAVDNARLYAELEELFRSSIRAVVFAVEAKDRYTRGHTERVTKYSVMTARELGLSRAEMKRVEIASLLHDVGKIGIPDTILGKPGKLTDEEFEIVKAHPIRGTEIMAPIGAMKEIIPGIRHHHERFDGLGYPDKLRGKEIPILGRIIAVSDVFDALTTDRPYRGAVSVDETLEYLQSNAGYQFDPEVVEAFCRAFERERDAQEDMDEE
jgi:HD-GYP domain-containing protein (c-di-GMP phosphodiesterase class II)